MIERLCEEDIELLLSRIKDDGKEILSPLKQFNNSFNFYKMYNEIIASYDKTFQERLSSKVPTFREIFEILMVSSEHSKIPNFQKKFIDHICSIPFDNTDSKFLNELKSDGLNLSYVSIFLIKFDQFDYAYNLLDYLFKNIEILPAEEIEEFYITLRFLLNYIDDIIDKKLSQSKVMDIKILLLRGKIRDIHYLYSVADNW